MARKWPRRIWKWDMAVVRRRCKQRERRSFTIICADPSSPAMANCAIMAGEVCANAFSSFSLLADGSVTFTLIGGFTQAARVVSRGMSSGADPLPRDWATTWADRSEMRRRLAAVWITPWAVEPALLTISANTVSFKGSPARRRSLYPAGITSAAASFSSATSFSRSAGDRSGFTSRRITSDDCMSPNNAWLRELLSWSRKPTGRRGSDSAPPTPPNAKPNNRVKMIGIISRNINVCFSRRFCSKSLPARSRMRIIRYLLCKPFRKFPNTHGKENNTHCQQDQHTEQHRLAIYGLEQAADAPALRHE